MLCIEVHCCVVSESGSVVLCVGVHRSAALCGYVCVGMWWNAPFGKSVLYWMSAVTQFHF